MIHKVQLVATESEHDKNSLMFVLHCALLFPRRFDGEMFWRGAEQTGIAAKRLSLRLLSRLMREVRSLPWKRAKSLKQFTVSGTFLPRFSNPFRRISS